MKRTIKYLRVSASAETIDGVAKPAWVKARVAETTKQGISDEILTKEFEAMYDDMVAERDKEVAAITEAAKVTEAAKESATKK